MVGVGFLSAVRRGGRDRSLPSAGQPTDRPRRRRRADRLSRLGRQHALAARNGSRQFQAAGPAAHAGTNGARRHRHLLGVGRALRSAAEGREARLSRTSRRSIPSPRCSASPVTRLAASACSRRRSSRASAARETPCWPRCCCFAASITSVPFVTRDGAAGRRRGGAPLALDPRSHVGPVGRLAAPCDEERRRPDDLLTSSVRRSRPSLSAQCRSLRSSSARTGARRRPTSRRWICCLASGSAIRSFSACARPTSSTRAGG